MNNLGIDPSATQDIEMGHIDLDDEGGWPMGGIGANDDLTGDNAGHRQSPDRDTGSKEYYILDYPGQAGQPIREAKTIFERTRQANDQAGQAPWAPFADKDEWEFGLWMLRTLGRQQMDDLLKLNFIKLRTNISFHNSYTFLKKVDSIPTGPGWTCEMVGLPRGPDGVEHEAELWSRNVNECVAALLGNVGFQDHIAYKPTKVFKDAERTERLYGEAWTADWWWETQAKLPIGATVAPVIISTDKTRLTNLSGDQTAWPMNHLPEGVHSVEIYRLFHHCMHRIFQPMEESGRHGIDVVCGDGVVRRVYPILSSYIADYPEQCLVACCMENRCPCCTVLHDERGTPLHSALRQPDSTLITLRGHGAGDPVAKQAFDAEGLRAIYNPFWAELPHCTYSHASLRISCTNYTREYFTASLTLGELDAHFKAIPGHLGLRHFKHGISGISQWTRKEHKAMEMVFLGAIAGAVDKRVVLIARSIMDFIYYAQLQTHSAQTIANLEHSLADFHANKTSLIDLGVRRHFNIPKVHNVSHYADSIHSRGSLDVYNTEASERLHIDYAKDAYRASNRRDYVSQMTRWLQRREVMHTHSAFISCDQDCGDSEEPVAEYGRGSTDKPSASSVTVDSYYIAKKSPYPGLHPGEIERVYNITGFLPTLTSFLRARCGRPSVLPTANDRFDCFNQVGILLPTQPWVASSPQNTKTIVRATPSRQSKNPRTPVMQTAQFDPAFVLEDPATESVPNPGPPVRIARIHIIFRLPPHLDHSEPPHPHAFVKWYTHLGPVDPTTGMHHVSRATRNRQPHTAVICITQVLRGCHLIPHFPRNIDREWTHENSLDVGTRFFVNPYINLSTFVASKNI
ncbi:hypothetical protein BC826DRAFT_1093882 [Russula brevipes]|nr:hypothetical protein BC826DRAFT_1093882 [Russula brevipes]